MTVLGDMGHIRHRPELSVGAVEYLLNEDKEGLLRRTRQVLAADGQKVRKVAYDTMNCKFQIDAAYEND